MVPTTGDRRNKSTVPTVSAGHTSYFCRPVTRHLRVFSKFSPASLPFRVTHHKFSALVSMPIRPAVGGVKGWGWGMRWWVELGGGGQRGDPPPNKCQEFLTYFCRVTRLRETNFRHCSTRLCVNDALTRIVMRVPSTAYR